MGTGHRKFEECHEFGNARASAAFRCCRRTCASSAEHCAAAFKSPADTVAPPAIRGRPLKCSERPESKIPFCGHCSSICCGYPSSMYCMRRSIRSANWPHRVDHTSRRAQPLRDDFASHRPGVLIGQLAVDLPTFVSSHRSWACSNTPRHHHNATRGSRSGEPSESC